MEMKANKNKVALTWPTFQFHLNQIYFLFHKYKIVALYTAAQINQSTCVKAISVIELCFKTSKANFFGHPLSTYFPTYHAGYSFALKRMVNLFNIILEIIHHVRINCVYWVCAVEYTSNHRRTRGYFRYFRGGTWVLDSKCCRTQNQWGLKSLKKLEWKKKFNWGPQRLPETLRGSLKFSEAPYSPLSLSEAF